eukprot:CAMPEP_0174819130 /NCGR_PEP_ID=MMETSP1107-20130205/2176_1 /TAXON_ID=36770 /ORGANISM="Paraphysomonas vestita, Strain GFlagA" /LENGTH=59 /DNA_ID=CAMNT_0016032053 /DNA_START=68 /DNA_END=247 /DNA_ORIENTATION=-
MLESDLSEKMVSHYLQHNRNVYCYLYVHHYDLSEDFDDIDVDVEDYDDLNDYDLLVLNV